MIFIILSLGALNAFIPLIIILILIAAAAGLMRGYNIFSIFGISALLGMSQAKGSMAGKSASRATSAYMFKSRIGKVISGPGGVATKLGKTTQAKAINTMNAAKSYAQLGNTVYLAGLSQGLTRYQALSASKNAVSAQRHADKLSGLSNPSGGALDKLEKNIKDAESKGLLSIAQTKNIYTEIADAKQAIANAAQHARNAANDPANAAKHLSSAEYQYQIAKTKAANAINLASNAAKVAKSRVAASNPGLTGKMHSGMVKLAAESKVHGNPNYTPGVPPNMKKNIHNPKIAQKYENLASDIEQKALAKIPNKVKTATGYNYVTSPHFKTDIQNNQIIEGMNDNIKKANKITKML